MSEEILKALMQMFAIVTKQDDGTSLAERNFVEIFLRSQLPETHVAGYMELFDEKAEITNVEEFIQQEKLRSKGELPPAEVQLTSVKDSVKILGICKKINKTLSQKQKAIVLVRMYELLNTEKKFTEQRISIINTAGKVFNISNEELKDIESFVINNQIDQFEVNNLLIVSNQDQNPSKAGVFIPSSINGEIIILKIESVDLYFMRYTGRDDIQLNGLPINNNNIYLFANGSTIRPAKGKPIYFSDVASKFLAANTSQPISFNAYDLEYKFPAGNIGLRNINISENQGKLISIMGASGAGKTTLLNVLAGLLQPSAGKVLINNIDLHEDKDKIQGVIGYVPQDDLLIEELTVFENLFYNAKLCFDNLNDEEIAQLVDKTLAGLGLNATKNLKVGNPLNKTISGGQRKRLNIALELIREPGVLFLDEPTSGLSSKDSENVLDLLRELSQKGKLIFVVIHQPSSDIYKMFDKLILLDSGGYQVFYGNPVDAVMHFKKLDLQVNADIGECVSCGNVNPELVFNILEANAVDEYGNFTGIRKVTPQKWNDYYKELVPFSRTEDIHTAPPKSLSIPGKIKQLAIFIKRDFLSKIANTQYVIINLIEAPLLAFFLSFIIRYISNPKTGEYIFKYNENIPAYIFMSIIVALFIGLTVSAEEIYRDQKILKRESFLNLSRLSYLLSKVIILTCLSALQTLLFVLIGNMIVEVKGLTLDYWIMLFTVSCFANMLGLNISSSFNSAVTIYILIPLLIIPQMILGGAMFAFDKLNNFIGGGLANNVPPLAELMTSRWAYEGLIVNQFTNNPYEKEFFDINQLESEADYMTAIYLPELDEKIAALRKHVNQIEKLTDDELQNTLLLLQNEFNFILTQNNKFKFKVADLQIKNLNEELILDCEDFIETVKNQYTKQLVKVMEVKDKVFNKFSKNEKTASLLPEMEKKYTNEYLSDLLKKNLAKYKIIESGNKLYRVKDPIYYEPQASFFGIGTHFYSPVKYFLGIKLSTFWFNVIMIWWITFLLFLSVYFDLLKKILDFSSSKFLTIQKQLLKKQPKPVEIVKSEKNETIENND